MVDRREQVISLTPSLVLTIEDPVSTSSLSSRVSTTSKLPTTESSNSRTSFSSTASPTSTTIVTVTIPSTHTFSPRTSYLTRTFTPTGYQSIVPTYPPLTSSSSSTSFTTNGSSVGLKLGLGLGIPFLVLLILLLTIVLHRRQVRLAKHYHHQNSSSPEMATTISTTEPAFPRLHPAPSSRFSTAGDVVVTPAPGMHGTPTPPPPPGMRSTPVQLYFPPPPSPPPPVVPRRSSARLRPAGPLTSHPPIRPASSIYDGGENAIVRESFVGLGGNGVGNVLAEYLDLNPQHLEDGPRDSDQVHVPALVLPPTPVARSTQQDPRRQYLSVDVDYSPGGIEEVSPLSTSSSGPHIPARISVMSALSPSSLVRSLSRRRT